MGEVSNRFEFRTATASDLMSSQHIRPWLAAAARCSRNPFRPRSTIQLRSLTTEAAPETPPRLQTPEDWTQLTTHREQLSLLSA
jgi:hypothetical protein